MKFYIICNGHQIGPVEKDELPNYGLTPNSMIWTEGMSDWMPAYAVPEVRELLQQRRTTPPPYSEGSTTPPPRSDFFDSLSYTGSSGKSRLVFALFAILIGCLGLQYFYVNKTSAGVLTILLSFLTCGLWQIIMLIQGILVLAMPQEEFERKYVYTLSNFPLF